LGEEIEVKILLCTDGSAAAEKSAMFVRFLNFPKESQCLLCHIVKPTQKPPAERNTELVNIFEPLERIIEEDFTEVKRKVRSGNPTAQIMAETKDTTYDLVVMGATGQSRGLMHQHLGSTVKKVVQMIEMPILITRGQPERLSKVLMCTGGEKPAIMNLREGGRLVSYSDAQVSILHVMSQLELKTGGQSDDLLDTAESAIQRGTREGIHLFNAKEQIRRAGVTAPITPVLRHGLVLEQVLAEIQDGRYDLLVIGSHHVSGKGRFFDILLENIASHLIAEAPCSVLVV
jgi:nucleotide-binding universal stress UspA family protein